MTKFKTFMKVLAVIATLALVAALGMILWTDQKENGEKDAVTEEWNNKRRPLTVQLSKLEKELEDMEEAFEAVKNPKATTQMIFTDMNPQIYTTCYPVLKGQGFVGTLVVSKDKYPGQEGCLTEEQFKEMIEEGWSVCVQWSTEPKQSWLPELKKKIEKLKATLSTAVYFPDDTYNASLDTKIQNMGFTIAFYNAENQSSPLQVADEPGVWHLGAVGFMSGKPKFHLVEAVNQKANIAYLIGFERDAEAYNERSFRSMLTYFKRYAANDEIIVGTAEDAKNHYLQRSENYAQQNQQEHEEKKGALQSQIDALKKQLQELDAEYENK